MTINQCVAGCELGRPGEAQWLGVQEGKSIIFVVGGGDRLHFSTGRSKSNDPPGRNRGKHDNQS